MATEGTAEGGPPATSSPKVTAGQHSDGSTDAVGQGDDRQLPQGK